MLSAEQKATDYKSPDDGIVPDHRPTNACIRLTVFEFAIPFDIIIYEIINFFLVLFFRVVAYLSRVLEAAFTALEGLNKQAFLTELVCHIHISYNLILPVMY